MKNLVSDPTPAPATATKSAAAEADVRPWSARVSEEFSQAFSKDNPQLKPALYLGGLILALLYAYWNTLDDLSGFWSDDQYQHGWFIPVFTMVVLWMWRQPFGNVPDSERWIGVGILSAALGLRVLFAYYVFNTPGMATFPLALLGVFVMVGGLSVLKWAAAPILFLIFMFPLPMAGERYVLKPLNTVAVTASTYTLQTLGVECYRTKNVIHIDQLDDDLAVIDQCSGLRMVTIFLALAVGYAMVVPMHWWERVIIVLFAIPIAVFVNLGRIVVTGLLYIAAENTTIITKEMAKHVFHDWAGYFMMPAALGLLFLLRYVMSRLVVEESVVHATVRSQPASPRLGTLAGK